MNPTHAATTTKFKVGIFSIMGILLIGAMTVFVNDRPFWWKGCNRVHISLEDATGLKTKSPVRSLGLQIGYINQVILSETLVKIEICVTAPVEMLPTTRAYPRGEGFLGDKFLELKPVRYVGNMKFEQSETVEKAPPQVEPSKTGGHSSRNGSFWNWLMPSAYAEEPKPKEIPVGEPAQDIQNFVKQADGLVKEITALTSSLREAINPKQIQETMTQLNKTLENASKTLSPEGGLTATAQRALTKLEDAIEQMRDMLTRVNRGEGSVGMLLNDPAYAEELKEAIRNVNKLLGKVGGIRFVVDLGIERLDAYDGSRGWFHLSIWPQPDRYYRVGITMDPRGSRKVVTTTTVAGGSTSTVQTTTVDENGILLTGMLGKVLWKRLDLSGGVQHSDGTASMGLLLGPRDDERMLQLKGDVYSRGKGFGLDYRATAIVRPSPPGEFWSSVYFRGGLESFKKVAGSTNWFAGAGVAFDDEDIKLLFAFK